MSEFIPKSCRFRGHQIMFGEALFIWKTRSECLFFIKTDTPPWPRLLFVLRTVEWTMESWNINDSSFAHVSCKQIISNFDRLDLIDLIFNFVFEMVWLVGFSLVLSPWIFHEIILKALFWFNHEEFIWKKENIHMYLYDQQNPEKINVSFDNTNKEI